MQGRWLSDTITASSKTSGKVLCGVGSDGAGNGGHVGARSVLLLGPGVRSLCTLGQRRYTELPGSDPRVSVSRENEVEAPCLRSRIGESKGSSLDKWPLGGFSRNCRGSWGLETGPLLST